VKCVECGGKDLECEVCGGAGFIYQDKTFNGFKDDECVKRDKRKKKKEFKKFVKSYNS